MKKLAELIPTPESIMRRTHPAPVVKPTEGSLNVMRQRLAEYGYKPANPDVYDSICGYGALMLDGTASKGLLLKGECGLGKTLGVEILAVMFKIPVFSPYEICAAFKEFDGNKAKLETYITNGGDYFEQPHDIVLDEIGVQDTVRNYGEISDIMADVLDMRYRAFGRFGVKTIATTNLNDKEIHARYGTRIDDRLGEMLFIKRVVGRSLRKFA